MAKFVAKHNDAMLELIRIGYLLYEKVINFNDGDGKVHKEHRIMVSRVYTGITLPENVTQ